MQALCVSIHDVAPATWPACERLIDAVQAVVTIPLTLLVVPHYHRRIDSVGGRYERRLEGCLDAGHELALHGYTHLDEGPPPAGLIECFRRRIYTRGEGEFSSIDVGEARRRLERGMEWFAGRGWPLKGFVAPAWLLSDGSWQALRSSGFAYTTTLARFHVLPRGETVWSPSLVYSSRGASLQRASRRWNANLARRLRGAPLLRLSLHPPDVLDEHTLRHWQRLLESIAASRDAMTKSQFADALRGAGHDGTS